MQSVSPQVLPLEPCGARGTLGQGAWLIISAAVGLGPTNPGSCQGQAPAVCLPAGCLLFALRTPLPFGPLAPAGWVTALPGITTLKPATLLGHSQAKPSGGGGQMLVPCPPPTPKTHTFAQCVPAPWEGVQAERVMGGCRLQGDVNGLGGVGGMCVHACTLGRQTVAVFSVRWGVCPQTALLGNYMPATSSTSWHSGLGPPRPPI